jgi:ActR/RegA family two-component response regulator
MMPESAGETLKILIIDDDPAYQERLSFYADLLGHSKAVGSFEAAREALKEAEEDGTPFSVATVDLEFEVGKRRTPTSVGLDILQYIKQEHDYIACILITGSSEIAREFMRILKPGHGYPLDSYIWKECLDFNTFTDAISTALEQVRSRQGGGKTADSTTQAKDQAAKEVPSIPQTTLAENSEVVRILFLAANPIDTSQLGLDEEIRAIDQVLRQTKYRDKFDLRQHWAVQVSDLQESLFRHEPDIVHFSGHGSESSEIILKGKSGGSHPVSVRALSGLFSLHTDNVRCVVLNACYSERQAKAIAEHIDCVIGMPKEIEDEAAISFAAMFYQALGFGKDVCTAFNSGCVQIDLENLDEQNKPKLLSVKSDPKKVVFVRV